MAVNLVSFSVEGIPIDEIKVIKNNEAIFELPLNFQSKFPPFCESDPFMDHPNHHIRSHKGEFYPREKLYKNKGNTNVDSNVNDGFSDCRRKDLSENSLKSAVAIDPKLTKDLLHSKIRSSKFNDYPNNRDAKLFPKPMEEWKEDRDMNLLLEDSYQSTSVNRGRNEISWNEEFIIGKII